MKIFFILPLFFSLFALFGQVKYRTDFGQCSHEVLGGPTLKFVDLFNKTKSLLSIKQEIIRTQFLKNNYLTKYDISFDPVSNYLQFNYECPRPLFRFGRFEHQEVDSNTRILVENGDLYDNDYESKLRGEGKIPSPLPYLTIARKKDSLLVKQKILSLVTPLPTSFYWRFSELIYSDQEEITLILSSEEGPITLFLGHDKWDTKLKKVQNILKYLEAKKTIPIVINLVNLEKIVVKFSE